MRFRIGHAWAQADVGGDDGGVVLGRDLEVVGIGESGDVVADDRAGRAAASSTDARHVSTESGVVETRGERLDRRHHPVELLCLADFRTRDRL